MKPKKPKGKFAGKLVFQKGRWIVVCCLTCENYDDPCEPEAIMCSEIVGECEYYKWNGKEGLGTRPDLPMFKEDE